MYIYSNSVLNYSSIFELRPFYSDSLIQIGFNPSKADLYSKEYINFSRIPNSVYGLKNFNDYKLLYSYRQYFYYSNVNHNGDDKNYSDYNNFDSQGLHQNYLNTLFLSFIKDSKSYGIFTEFEKRDVKVNEVFETTFQNTLSTNVNSDSVFTYFKNEEIRFSLGLSYSSVKKDKEVLAEIIFSKNNSNDKSRIIYDYYSYNGVLESISKSNAKDELKSNSYELQFGIYLKDRLNWFSKDDFGFISASSIIKPRQYRNYKYSIDYFYDYKSEENQFTSNLKATDKPTRIKEEYYSAFLSSGYVRKKEFKKIDYSFGLVYQIWLYDEEIPTFVMDNYNYSKFEFIRVERGRNLIGQNLIFPFQFELTPKKWIQVFGGYSIYLNHTFILTEDITLKDKYAFNNPKVEYLNELEKRENHKFETKHSLFLSVKLNHKSGFYIGKSFSIYRNRIDLFDLRYNVYLGYEFWKWRI